jgi:cytochrome P450
MLRSSAAASGGGGGVAAEDFIVDNCKNIYFAGYETTAVTAAWCLMLLALHPEWQAQVRDEARQACAAAAAAPDFTSLQRMKKVGSSSVGFIHSFIHSSMNARTDTHV